MTDYSLEWALLDSIIGPHLPSSRDDMHAFIKDIVCPEARIYIYSPRFDRNEGWAMDIFARGTTDSTFGRELPSFEDLLSKLTDPSFRREHRFRIKGARK